MKIVHRTDASKMDWTKFKYMVFDIPDHSGTYEERYSNLRNTPTLILLVFPLFNSFTLLFFRETSRTVVFPLFGISGEGALYRKCSSGRILSTSHR